MTTPDAGPRPPREQNQRRPAPRRRSLQQIAEGVRRQREHILLMDGSDPLRGGVAD